MAAGLVPQRHALLDFDAIAIREHYDSLSLWYRLFWGDHLHHGWFETGNEPPRQAQLEMLRQCVSMLGSPSGVRVLDVGCGYGGTSIFLASELGCHVDGLSLSPNQLEVATRTAAAAGVGKTVSFRRQNAETFAYPDGHYDLVWTMESSEHFLDKPRYFQRVACTLRSGGQLLVAAWTGSMADHRVRDVAQHFLCPEICTGDQYAGFIDSAGLKIERVVDATQHVIPTWQICVRRLKRFAFVKPLAAKSVRSFGDGINIILDAYLSGQLTYTIIAARR